MMIALDKNGKYLGESEILDDEFLTILDKDGNADYEIDLWSIKHVINLTNPCYPEGYYQEVL